MFNNVAEFEREVLAGLLETILTLLESLHHPDLLNTYPYVTSQFLRVVIHTDNDEVRRFLLYVSTTALSKRANLRSSVILHVILDLDLDGSKYQFRLNVQSVPGLLGLRNFGSICYRVFKSFLSISMTMKCEEV
jgi:hypothetical protein